MPTPPGSESTACFKGYQTNVGDPVCSPRKRVLINKSNKREDQDDGQEVSWVIVPMKRVTTVEGRALGNIGLQGETFWV